MKAADETRHSVNPTAIYQDSVTQQNPFMHAWAKTPSKIYSLIDSARDYSSSARGLGSSQNGAIVNDGGT